MAQHTMAIDEVSGKDLLSLLEEDRYTVIEQSCNSYRAVNIMNECIGIRILQVTVFSRLGIYMEQ